MAIYSKKLHIRKSGIVTDINLYTTSEEVGFPYLSLKDSYTTVYAKLGVDTDVNASALKVRKDGTVYNVLTQANTAAVTDLLTAYKTATLGFSPEYAFDENIGTYGRTNAATAVDEKKLGLDFGSIPRIVNKVEITSTFVVQQQPIIRFLSSANVAYLKYSNDGTNWINVQKLEGIDKYADKIKYSWDITGVRQAARYWAIWWDPNDAFTGGVGFNGVTYFAAYEIRFFGQ